MLCLCEVGPTKTADLRVLQGEFCSSCTYETVDRHAVCHDPWPPCRAMQVQKAASQQYLKALTMVICSFTHPSLLQIKANLSAKGRDQGADLGPYLASSGWKDGRAYLSVTYTLAAQPQEVGLFQTIPASATHCTDK